MLYELVARNTDGRYSNDIRWCEYTTSERRARLFKQIPKLQFTDSGHGIVFNVHHHSGPRKELDRQLADYVLSHMQRLSNVERVEQEIQRLKVKLATKESQLAALQVTQ